MPNVVLLSEIHPDAQHAKSFNILKQAQDWYGIHKELNAFKTPFIESVELIRNWCHEHGKTLIIRDWSHVDYIGPPVTETPSNTAKLILDLKPNFTLKHIQLLRHPIDTWLSFSRLNLAKKHGISFDDFCLAYLNYLENTSADSVLCYEQFSTAPEIVLKRVANESGFIYDTSFLDNWYKYKNITGDNSNSTSLRGKKNITSRPNKPITPDIEKLITHCSYFKELATKLTNFYPDLSEHAS